MQLHLLCLLTQLYLTVSGSKVDADGVIEMPPKGISYKGVEKNVWDVHVPVKNESERNILPRNDEDADNDTRGVIKHFPRHEHWDLQHIIYKFDTQCQTDVKTMDFYCNELLVKLRHRMKIKLELPDLQKRQMKAEVVLCVSKSPIAIEWYDPTQDLCCNGIHRKNTGKEMCCGTERFMDIDTRAIYDKTQQLCCRGVIYNETKSHRTCCGSYVYDRRSTIACCNDKLYDPRHKFCCDGTTLHHNIGRKNRNGRCCGVEKFDNRCYSCSKDTEIRPLFNPQIQRCCHGRIKRIEDNKTICCGKQLMDASKHLCIGNSIVMKDRIARASQSDGLYVNITEKTFKEISDTKNHGELFNVVTPPDTNYRRPSLGALLSTSFTVVGVLVITAVILCLRKEKKGHKGPKAYNYEIDTKSEITGPVRPVIISNTDCESGLESGYHSLQQTASFKCELTIDGSDNYGNSQEGLDNGLTAVEKAAKGMTGIRVLSLLEDNVPKVTNCYEKLLTNKDTNLTSELFSDAETQTLKPKESNQRDVFGNAYQHTQYLDKFNRTVQWDKSDSKMTLPASAITLHKLFVQASSFNDIPAILKKFRLTADKRLASPVVEYCFTGCKSLTEHALVELPILKGGSEVYKFPSDGGINQLAELESIPVLEEEDFSFNTFCIIKREKVLIYTKTFTGFMCLIHGHRQNFNLKAYLFASYKKAMQNPEVRLNLYIADALHDFRDYKEPMFDKEQRAERKIEDEKPLVLPDLPHGENLCGEDYLEITAVVQSELPDMWEHKLHPLENRPIEKELKIVKMKHLSRCCQSENWLPYHEEWIFINKGHVTPSPVVQVVVDITCKLSDQRAESERTPLYIDELKIRDCDRTEVLSDCQRVSSLKQFLTQFIEPLKREAILATLNEYVRRLDSRVALSDNLMDILKVMEKVLHPTDFVRAISDILHQMKEFDTLDYLVNNKVIPGHLLQKPVQPQQQNIESRPQVTGGASNILSPESFTFGNEVSAIGNIVQGDCRPEMETIYTRSFDNNEGAVGHNAEVSRPGPELRNTDINESSISGLQHVADTTATDIETETIFSELFISDSDF